MKNIWTMVIILGAVLALLAGPPPGYGDTEADRLFRDGVASYLRGDLVTAQAALEAALRQSPTHENARRLLDEVSAESRRLAPAAALPAPAAPQLAAPAPVPVYASAARGAGMSEGLVTLGPVAAGAPTAVAVPPQTLAPMLTERLVLRGEAVTPGVKALTGIEVYNEGNALKIRLTVAGTVDLMEAKAYQPPLITIDLLGCRDALPNRPLAVGAGALVRVRHQKQRAEPLEMTRVTLDLNRLVPYTVERVPGGVVITIPGTTGLVAPVALGEPPFFRPTASGLRPLTAYRVQSHWLRIVAGEKQIGVAGTLLPGPMGLQVTDAAGVPQPGVPVWLTVTGGSGFFRGANGEKADVARVVTDAQGQALVEGYVLSPVAGDNVVIAALNEGGSGVTFLHTSVPGEATDIAKVHGDEQEGLAGNATDQPLVVEVRDRFANPVPGQRVVFTVLYNDGTADVNPDRWGTQSVVVTDEHGRARLDKFKLGTRLGVNRVRASIVAGGGSAGRGGLLVTTAWNDRDMLVRNGEVVRPQAAQEHVPLFVEEMLRDLPGSLDAEDIQVYGLGEVTTSDLKRRLGELLPGSSDALRFYQDGNAVYISPGAGTDLVALEAQLQALTRRPLMRKAVRSVVFTEYGRPQLISVDFRDAAVVDVVRTLAEIAGWNVVFPVVGDPIYTQQVTVHLAEVPAKDVLDNLLAQVGYGRIENDGIIRIVKRAEMAANETRLGVGIDLDRFEGEEDEVITYFIPVRSRKPSEILTQITKLTDANANPQADDAAGYIMLTDRVANIRRVLQVVKLLDKSQSAVAEDLFIKVVTLRNASAASVGTILTSLYPLLAPGGSATGSFLFSPYAEERGTFLLVTPRSLSTKVMEIIERLDTANNVDREVLMLALNRINPTDMTAMLAKLYPGLANYISAIPSSNTLLILAPKDQAEEIRAVIVKIDQNLTDIVEGNMQREVIRMQRLDPLRAEQILKQSFPGAQIFALGQEMSVTSKYKDADGNTVTRDDKIYVGLYGLLVIANRQDIDLMKKVIEAMDLSPFPQGFTMTTYRPKYQSVLQLKQWAELMIGTTGQGKIIGDDYTNRLMVWDTADNAGILMDFFAKMDVSPNDGLATRSVTLGSIDPTEMATVLALVYRGVFLPSTTAGKKLLFVQVPREVMPQVLATINELDQMALGETIAVVPLTADAVVTDIETDLKALFPNLNILSSEWPAPALILAGDASSVDKAKAVLRELDQPLLTRTFRITYGEATNIESLLTDFLTTKGKASSDGRTNSVVITDVTSNMPRLERIIRELDRNVTGEGESGTRVFFLKYAQAADLVSVLSQVVQPTRGTNDLQVLLGTLSADARTNSILVNSTPANMPLIANLITKLDERTPQVLIEATILEYSLQDDENMGFVWSFSDRFGGFSYSSSFTGNVGGPFSLTLSKGQLSVVMDALNSSQRSNVLSSPRLLTLNNKAANITIGTNRQQQESRTDPNTGAVTTSFVTKTADLVVDVTPQIGSDRSVMLEFALDLEQFIPTTDPTELPTNTRKLTNSIIVADGQTLVIGGIITDQENLSRSGVLGLMDIPVIGNIFSNRRNGKQKVELMIFLTPKVIANAAEGDVATREMAQEAQILTPLPVNINVAGADEIVRLPGLRAQDDVQHAGLIANRIVRHREMYGPYQSLEELKFVPGIDDRTFDAIVYRLKYQIEVNQASLEDLRAIKGVTLPIAQGVVKYRNEHGSFIDYDTVKRVFVQLGYPAETYDIYLSDIISIGNVYREQVGTTAPAVAAAAPPRPGVAPLPLPGRPGQPAPVVTAPPATVRPNAAAAPAYNPPVYNPPVSAPVSGLLNLNTATVEQLRGVGLDEIAAKLAVAYRTRNGSYASVEDLKKVSGIPLEMYNRVKDKLTVGGAAPAADDNGIMLMPNLPGPAPAGRTASAEEDNGLLMMPNLAPGVGGGAPVPRLNLNTATAEQLSRLPGIDLLKAKMLIAYRYTYGDFGSVAQAGNVPYLNAEDVATLAQYAEVR